jgi:hypothetical protein
MSNPPLRPCGCPEAELLREILSGQVPAIDSPAWRALAAAIETRAARLAAEHTRQVSHAVSAGLDAARAVPARARSDPGEQCGRYFCPGVRACLDCPLDRIAMSTEHAA